MGASHLFGETGKGNQVVAKQRASQPEVVHVEYARVMNHMSRRMFIESAASIIALPFLESLVPRSARAAAAAALPKRMIVFHAPCGINMQAWTPIDTGPNYTLSQTLQPLANLKQDVLVMNDVSNLAAVNPTYPTPGLHALGMATLTSSAACVPSNGSAPQVGTSMDQMYAQFIAGQTPVNSLQLGVDMNPDCDLGLPCVDVQTISWASPTTPLLPLTDALSVFNSYFATANNLQSAAAASQRLQLRKSVLDGAVARISSISARLGVADGQKLDQYLTNVRQVELQLASTVNPACGFATAPVDPAPLPSGIPDYPTLYKNMMDLMVLAYQCDLTRTITFSFGPGHCQHDYSQFLPGISDIHHSLSHEYADPVKLAQITQIDTWEVSVFAYFLAQMKAIPEGAGSLLDNTVAVFTSELSSGTDHSYWPLPMLVAGRGGGIVNPGRCVSFANNGNDADSAALWLALMQGYGVPVETWGIHGVTQPLVLT